MDMKSIINQLAMAHSPSGHETGIRDIINSHLGTLADDVSGDRMGNTVWHFRGQGKDLPVLSFLAHADEVGFVVERVLDSGFLQVIGLGGWNPDAVSSQLMKVRSGEKWIDGVTTVPAPHLVRNAKGGMEDRPVYIDIGAKTADEVLDAGIVPGSVVVPRESFVELMNGRCVAKAFDDRAGIAMMIGLGLKMKQENIIPRAHVQLAMTVQEEVGTRGARTFYHTFAPDYAVILEGPPADDTPDIMNSLRQGVLGKGPQVRTYDATMIPSEILVRGLRNSASELDIPVQLSVRKTGATDGRDIHLSGPGVPSVVFSVPVRGAHSPHSVIDMKDLYAAVDVLADFVKNFEVGTD